MIVAGNGIKERILTKGSHGKGEALKSLVVHSLIGKCEHLVPKPGFTDICDEFFAERSGQVTTGDARTA